MQSVSRQKDNYSTCLRLSQYSIHSTIELCSTALTALTVPNMKDISLSPGTILFTYFVPLKGSYDVVRTKENTEDRGSDSL